MSARVAGVYVHDPKTLAPVFYGPDDEVPDEHAALIGDHVWTDGARPVVEQPNPQSVPDGTGGGDGGAATLPNDAPARSATRGEWDAYAEDKDIDISGASNKDDVIATVEAWHAAQS